MIEDLDKTLATLLQQELLPDILEKVEITFATPDEDFRKSLSRPAIDLFLFDVRENRDLRTNEWLVERNGGTVTREPPPVRVACSYLVTAWPSEASKNAPRDEHHMLGAVIVALLRHPVLPPGVLRGALVSASVEHPTTILQPGRPQGMADFWQALGGRPRAGFTYTVTTAFQPFAPVEAGPPVTERVFEIGEWREPPGTAS